MRYSAKTLHYFRQNHFSCVARSNCQSNCIIGRAGDAKLGDEIYVYLQLKDKQLIDCCYRAYGGVATIAAIEYTCEKALGQTTDAILAFTNELILTELALPSVKVHAVNLALNAFENAIREGR